MRNFKITKGLSWYYIFSFVAIFGLAVYLYQSLKIREGATNPPINGPGSIAWFRMASGGAPFIGKRNGDGTVQHGQQSLADLVVVQEVEIGNKVVVIGIDNKNGEIIGITDNKNGEIIGITDSKTGYSGKQFTIKYEDNSPQSTSDGSNLQLNTAATPPVQTTKSVNTSSPPVESDGDEE